MTVGGEAVEVREFRYLEGLQAAGLARPVLAGLRELIEAEGEIQLEALDALIGAHADTWLTLIGMSTGRDLEWLAALSDQDGLALSLAFWRVNGPFFTRRLVLAAAAKGQATPSRSPKSSPPSSAPATEATTTTSRAD